MRYNLDVAVSLTITSLYIYLNFDEVNARRKYPCWGPDCHFRHRLKRLSQRSVADDTPVIEEDLSQYQSLCEYPCKCRESTRCHFGVRSIKDGCNCCYMCARQQGDICNHRDMCDEQKNLYCHFNSEDEGQGVCRARNAAPCEVDGQTYKDGEQFSPSCRQICSCQNGVYACSSLCPHEDKTPSGLHCANARLMTIHGQCCKQWICPVPQDHSYLSMDRPHPDPGSVDCNHTAEWSACSVTCGMGKSFRVTNHNEDCQSVHESRLCMVRPCDLTEEHMMESDGRCKTTWRQTEEQHFEYGGCISAKKYRPKYCTTCKKKRCCMPDSDKTLQLTFECKSPSLHDKVYNFAWIKSCACGESCQ